MGIKKANYSVSVDGRPISHSLVFNSVNRAGERKRERQADRLGRENVHVCVCA